MRTEPESSQMEIPKSSPLMRLRGIHLIGSIRIIVFSGATMTVHFSHAGPLFRVGLTRILTVIVRRFFSFYHK